MAIIVAVPILGSLLIIQSAILSQVPLLQGTTDLVLIAVIAWALQKRVQTSWHWGIIGGLLVDIVSGLPFGAYIVSYLLAVGLSLILRQRVWQVPIFAMLVATFFGTLITYLVSFILLQITGTQLPVLEMLNLVILPSILLNLVIALPIYALINDLSNWFYPEEMEM